MYSPDIHKIPSPKKPLSLRRTLSFDSLADTFFYNSSVFVFAEEEELYQLLDFALYVWRRHRGGGVGGGLVGL
jgi:hypothetical protein